MCARPKGICTYNGGDIRGIYGDGICRFVTHGNRSYMGMVYDDTVAIFARVADKIFCIMGDGVVLSILYNGTVFGIGIGMAYAKQGIIHGLYAHEYQRHI